MKENQWFHSSKNCLIFNVEIFPSFNTLSCTFRQIWWRPDSMLSSRTDALHIKSCSPGERFSFEALTASSLHQHQFCVEAYLHHRIKLLKQNCEFKSHNSDYFFLESLYLPIAKFRVVFLRNAKLNVIILTFLKILHISQLRVYN